MSRSQRIIAALRQLDQFALIQSDGEAVCALTGVRVTPAEDPDDDGHGLLYLAFPGAQPVLANGDLYLQLQVITSARLETDGPQGRGPVASRVQDLLTHLLGKHDL